MLTPEDVLAALNRRDRPWLTPKAVLKQLDARRHDLPRVREVLRALAAEGRVERLDGRYRLARADGLVEALFTATGEGRGEAVEDTGRVRTVADAGEAETGDRVLLAPGAEGRGAAVVHVLARERRQWIGILSRDARGGFVTPYRDDAEWGLRIPASALGEARDGDVVVVERARRKGREPLGRVVEALGPPGTPEADFRAVVWRRRLPVEFPAAVLKEAERAGVAPADAAAAEVGARLDLRDHDFLTIDPASARDHDDAVCVERARNGALRLRVAIADVSYYVVEGSALDREALRRGNSVYFPDRAIPMLPEVLSGNVCSLRPDEDRFALCVELEVDRGGGVDAKGFDAVLIRSRARLAYTEAAAILAGEDPGRPLPQAVREQVTLLGEAAARLTRRRLADGALDFDLPEAKIVLDESGQPEDIVREPRTLAHRAIEEAMLAANRAVAERLERAGAPAVYRVHEPPTPAGIERLEDLLASLGLLDRRDVSRDLDTKVLAKALARVEGRPAERLVNMVTLRAMKQARYDAENLGHYALAFESYTHFTSPIRRYADLVVHRVLRDLLSGGPEAERRLAARAPAMDTVATRISWRERVAMEAEREMLDLKKCAFMAKHVGDEFDGTITGVARHGFYVTLDDFFVDGLVHVSRLPGYAWLDERSHALVIRGSGRRFALGDRVRVLVDQVDRVKAWINFSLAENEEEEPPHRKARTGREGREAREGGEPRKPKKGGGRRGGRPVRPRRSGGRRR